MVESDRYVRQINAFPTSKREASALVIFGAEANPRAGMSLVAGAAAMGIPVIGSDFPGPSSEDKSHWLLSGYEDLAKQLNPNVEYRYLDPDLPAVDLPYIWDSQKNGWLVLFLNDMPYARRILNSLVEARIQTGVMLGLTAPGGIVVQRCAMPLHALELVERLPTEYVDSGPTELGILAAGLVLNEIMAADQEILEFTQETIGFYSLHRPRRVSLLDEPVEKLFSEITKRLNKAMPTFTSMKFVMVGAGALANWAVIPLVLDGHNELVIYDGDPKVEVHNLNRQILLINGAGKNKPKVTVLAEELRKLEPRGHYEGIVKYIKSVDDLGSLDGVDSFLCLPDNNQARLTCDEARRGTDILFATGGSSPVGCQAIISQKACLRCLGITEDPTQNEQVNESCALVEEEAIVSTNMVCAGLLLSEIRMGLAGRPTANVRMVGDSLIQGNRLLRMISSPNCPHSVIAR